jgi:hypothetical protein
VLGSCLVGESLHIGQRIGELTEFALNTPAA